MNMDEIIKDLGWGDGFRIPVANSENKALEFEFQSMQKEKENLKSTFEDISNRVAGMKTHLANVHKQFEVNQNLIFAHNNQKAVEENLAKLARIENTSLLSDINKLKKERGDIQERQKFIQDDINQTLQQIEKLSATIKYDKDALLAWDEELARGDDDKIILEKFRKEDESKFKELELRRQQLGEEFENKRNRLITLKNEILSMEQSLDKTAQMFKRQHMDRRILVQQWEGSVRVLNQRDEDIQRVCEEVQNLKSLAKERLKDLEEQKTFFENEMKNNKELERDIDTNNKIISESKEKIRILETLNSEDHDKVEVLKTVLATTTTAYHKERNACKQMLKDIEMTNSLIEVMTLRVGTAKNELQLSKDKTASAIEKVQHAEELLKQEEKFVEKNLFEFKKLDELMHQIVQQINDLKSGLTSQQYDMSQIKSCENTTKKRIGRATTELNRQKEILYNMDFAYMEKDIQFNKMLNKTKEESSEADERKIAELEKTHAKLQASHNLLNKEVLRLEEDIRHLSQDFETDLKEQNYLKSKLQDKTLSVECGEKQVKTLKTQNQDKEVDVNLLKLRVKQSEKAIDKIGGKVFCLEKQRLELEEAMKEREVEIKTMRDVLNIRRRVLGEQSAGMSSKINLARLKVEHMKSKYEISILKLGTDECGETMSVTQMKIKAAQEKFELQEIGDKLDSKIKKTEKEILAMENTLKVVNATNRAFRNNLQSIDENSPEQMEKEELEHTHAELLSEYRKDKLILEDLNKVTIELEKQYQEKLDAEEELANLLKEKNQELLEVEKGLKEQEEKLLRAEKHLKKLIKSVRGTQIQKFQAIEERDIELRELMEQNEFGLQQLSELVAKTLDTGPIVARYLTEKNIALPLMKGSVGSMRQVSTTSLRSAGRSSASTASSKSSRSTGAESFTSKTSSCLITPSVVTLDSSRLEDDVKSGGSDGNVSRSGSLISLKNKKSSVSVNKGQK